MTSENIENIVSVRPLINGKLCQNYIGRQVALFGEVISTNPSGSSFDLKTPDLQVIIVSLRKPLMEPITGLVEVHGIMKGKNSIVCDNFLSFPPEISSNYDSELTNETISVLHSVPNPWTE